MVDTIRELDRQLKLKHLILDSFVPPKYVEEIELASHWDMHSDSWLVPGLELAWNNMQAQRDELAAAAAAATGDGRPVPAPMPLPAVSGVGFRRGDPMRMAYHYARQAGVGVGLNPLAGRGLAGAFDPLAARSAEIPPEVHRLLEAAATNQLARASKDVFFTYQGLQLEKRAAPPRRKQR